MFYNLNPFYFKTKVSDCYVDICSLYAHFYMFDIIEKKLKCFDLNGELIKEKKLMLEATKGDVEYEYIHFFNGKFLITRRNGKKLIIV